MSFFPLIVSYYVKDAQKLIKSCEKYHLAYHIEPIESFGSPELNASYKPFFLLSKLQEFKRPLFWVDSEGVFVQKPAVLEEFSADLAVRMQQPAKVLASSIFVNVTEEAKALLKQWAAICYHTLSDPDRSAEDFCEQEALRDAIFDGSHRAKVVPLSPSYTAIEGRLVDQKEIPHPVILYPG